MEEELILRSHLGLDENLKPIYEYQTLSASEYLNIKNSRLCEEFILEVEKSYELIVQNYIEFEKELFSIVLTNEINGKPQNQYPSIDSKINRMLLNLLTSTYLFSCKFIEAKRDNSDISKIKANYKKHSNNVHNKSYEYAFMSFLRNMLNHGGSLPKEIISGGMWSTYWARSEGDDNFIIAETDMRFSILDINIKKDKIKKKLKKYLKSEVRKKIPNEFYLRRCIRIYISEISGILAKLRPEMSKLFIESCESISSLKELKFKDKKYCQPLIIKKIKACIIEEISASNYSIELLESRVKINKAPLCLERYRMPAEYEERPTVHKNKS